MRSPRPPQNIPPASIESPCRRPRSCCLMGYGAFFGAVESLTPRHMVPLCSIGNRYRGVLSLWASACLFDADPAPRHIYAFRLLPLETLRRSIPICVVYVRRFSFWRVFRADPSLRHINARRLLPLETLIYGGVLFSWDLYIYGGVLLLAQIKRMPLWRMRTLYWGAHQRFFKAMCIAYKVSWDVEFRDCAISARSTR